jgi:hypothetical protein
LFGTENFGFCDLMKPFFSCIALATVLKKVKIRMQNVKFAGKIETQDEFNTVLYATNISPFFKLMKSG